MTTQPQRTPPAPSSGAEVVVPSVPQSVAEVRRYAVDVCRSSGCGVDCDTVALLVSELTTNALVHGSGQVRVRVLPAEHGLRVEVTDDSPVVPVPRSVSGDAEGGRGLWLVVALSSAWGVLPRGGGKTVWFELER